MRIHKATHINYTMPGWEGRGKGQAGYSNGEGDQMGPAGCWYVITVAWRMVYNNIQWNRVWYDNSVGLIKSGAEDLKLQFGDRDLVIGA